MNQQNLKSKSCLELDFLAKFKFSVGLVWYGFWYISYVNSTFYIHKVWYWKGHFVSTLSLVWYGLVWCQLNITCRVLVCISACPKSKSNICIENLDFFWYLTKLDIFTHPNIKNAKKEKSHYLGWVGFPAFFWKYSWLHPTSWCNLIAIF